MKKILFFVFVFMACPAFLHAKEVEKTIATVNGEHIMLSEFQKNVNDTVDQLKQLKKDSELTPEKMAKLKETILNQMIDEKLVLQKAKGLKIKITKREVDKGIDQVKTSNFKGDEEAFQKELKNQNLTETQFEDRIRDQLMEMKLIDQEVKAKLPEPDEKETKALYDKIKTLIDGKQLATGTTEEIKDLKDIADFVKKNFSELVRAQHILKRISKDETIADQLAAKKKLQELKKQIDEGADFGELAKKYSDDTGSAEQGGDLGYLPKDDFVNLFGKEVYDMKLGDVSDVVKSEFGYHLVKIEEKKAAKSVTYDQLSKVLENIIYKEKAEKKYAEWLKKLRAEAVIKTNPIE